MKTIKIATKIIGNEYPTFIIAEAGINHDGKIEQAKKLICKAAEIGADAVKFQIFKTEEFCSSKSEYFTLFKSLEFSDEGWTELAEFANQFGIIFTASVFGEASTDLLEKINSPVYKIASGDLTHLPLLNYVARKNKPIILSTGMSSLGEIEEAIEVIHSTGNQNIALLHCLSNYPAKHKETNLRVIKTLKDVLKVPVGFSDHTVGIVTPIAAVAIGANIIEKHFTLDKNLSGPDHKLSLEPDEFKEMVKNIRVTEHSLGNGTKKPTVNEKNIKKLVRRSITAKVDIPKGTMITKEAIKMVRPGDGIPPKFADLIVGRTAKKDIPKDDILMWGDI